VKPNVKEFAADGHSVLFEDGSTVNHLDCVLMATGFTVAFPYLSEEIITVNDNRVGIIELAIPCRDGRRHACFMIGSAL
jgi:hypothetical protein